MIKPADKHEITLQSTTIVRIYRPTVAFVDNLIISGKYTMLKNQKFATEVKISEN